MHNMFDENAEHVKLLRLFLSLLGSRIQPIFDGGCYLGFVTRRTG